jgi:DNA-binding CsgD family transcriptional regulator
MRICPNCSIIFGVKHLAIYGACGGVLIAVMQAVEYRFLVVEHSVEIYGALIAAAFAALGIWLGVSLTGRPVVVKEVEVKVPVEVPVEVRVPAPAGPFTPDAARIDALGITPRELEVLQLIAEGLSNKEMADRLFVSENTVKTHTSRVFDKLGASRRTQAVQLAKTQGLLA